MVRVDCESDGKVDAAKSNCAHRKLPECVGILLDSGVGHSVVALSAWPSSHADGIAEGQEYALLIERILVIVRCGPSPKDLNVSTSMESLRNNVEPPNDVIPFVYLPRLCGLLVHLTP